MRVMVLNVSNGEGRSDNLSGIVRWIVGIRKLVILMVPAVAAADVGDELQALDPLHLLSGYSSGLTQWQCSRPPFSFVPKVRRIAWTL